MNSTFDYGCSEGVRMLKSVFFTTFKIQPLGCRHNTFAVYWGVRKSNNHNNYCEYVYNEYIHWWHPICASTCVLCRCVRALNVRTAHETKNKWNQLPFNWHSDESFTRFFCFRSLAVSNSLNWNWILNYKILHNQWTELQIAGAMYELLFSIIMHKRCRHFDKMNKTAWIDWKTSNRINFDFFATYNLCGIWLCEIELRGNTKQLLCALDGYMYTVFNVFRYNEPISTLGYSHWISDEYH